MPNLIKKSVTVSNKEALAKEGKEIPIFSDSALYLLLHFTSMQFTKG
jgi:hypothetical protein